MDEITLLKAWARLNAFRQNLPDGNIEDTYVVDYHDILRMCEQETEQTFGEFFIPDSALLGYVMGTRQLPEHHKPPYSHNPFTAPSEQIFYCKREFFLMRLEAAITFFGYLIPEESKRRIDS